MYIITLTPADINGADGICASIKGGEFDTDYVYGYDIDLRSAVGAALFGAYTENGIEESKAYSMAYEKMVSILDSKTTKIDDSAFYINKKSYYK